MSEHSAASLEAARWLLDIKAVNFRPEEPYTFTAGWASPVYIDCRWVISFTEARRRIIELGVEGRFASHKIYNWRIFDPRK